MAKNDQEMQKQLRQTNDYLYKLTDWKHVLKRGVIRGLGVAIGATIVAGIVFAILAAVAEQAEDVPIIRDLIPENAVEETFNQ